MRLVVVIISYRSTDLTIDCLRSAVPEARAITHPDGSPACRLHVCENGSGDEHAEMLRSAVDENGWHDCVEITAISPNRGFSGGNNAVLRLEIERAKDPAARPELIMLLNNDTIVREGAFRVLLDAAAATPDAGVFSPRLEWPDGEPQISCFNDFSPLAEMINGAQTGAVTRLLARWNVPRPVSDETTCPGWTSFAAAGIRPDVWDRVGLLDEGFFLYFDDPDYCRRVRNAGWKIANVPAARVVHLRGRSNPDKSLRAERKRRPWYHYASRTRYYRKHYGPLGPLLANACWWLGHAIAVARKLAAGRDTPACDRERTDIWTNFTRPLAMPNKGQD